MRRKRGVPVSASHFSAPLSPPSGLRPCRGAPAGQTRRGAPGGCSAPYPRRPLRSETKGSAHLSGADQEKHRS
ncbi:hypothetical protein GN956_G54 [Arapaima gigas]